MQGKPGDGRGGGRAGDRRVGHPHTGRALGLAQRHGGRWRADRAEHRAAARAAEHGEPLLLPVALGYGRVRARTGGVPRLFLEQTFVTARRVAPAGAVAYALCDLAALARDAGDMAGSRALARGVPLAVPRARRRAGRRAGTGPARQPALRRGRARAGAGAARGEPRPARGGERRARDRSVAARDRGGRRATARSPSAPGRAPSARSSLFDRTDDGPGRRAAVMQLGYLAADAGRLREARELQERALALWQEFVPHTGWCAAILLELAELDAALGEPERVPGRLRAGRWRSSPTSATTSASRHCQAGAAGDKCGANARLTPRP